MWREREEKSTIYLYHNWWVLRARARLCAPRTRLFGLINTPNGALRAPPPIASALFLIRPQKINKNISNSITSTQPVDPTSLLRDIYIFMTHFDVWVKCTDKK